MNPVARTSPRGVARAIVPAAGLLVLAAVFVALGVWQVERRAWKHALIAAVDARVHAAPVAAPAPAAWPALTPANDVYRRVTATGRFLPGHDTLVRATTDLGSGYWVLTPLDTGNFRVLVNRGFVPPERRDATAVPKGPVRVTGLLRFTEPRGGFLRTNEPAANRWYSRDVAAIAGARGLGTVAPYFIDADVSANAPGAPVGGLTVVQFADNHAVYALTWFAMALLSLGAAVWLWRQRGWGE
ncbi:SURF1 family protein [Sphingomonas sp. CJ20]